MRIVRDDRLVRSQVCEKAEPPDAIGCYFFAVNHDGAAQELTQIAPVEIPAVLEFPHQTCRIEGIVRLPELQHNEAPDNGLVKWPRCEHAKVVDVPRFVSLIAG